MKQAILIGTTPQTVNGLLSAIKAIILLKASDSVTIKGLDVLQNGVQVTNTTIQNCHFKV